MIIDNIKYPPNTSKRILKYLKRGFKLVDSKTGENKYSIETYYNNMLKDIETYINTINTINY